MKYIYVYISGERISSNPGFVRLKLPVRCTKKGQKGVQIGDAIRSVIGVPSSLSATF